MGYRSGARWRRRVGASPAMAAWALWSFCCCQVTLADDDAVGGSPEPPEESPAEQPQGSADQIAGNTSFVDFATQVEEIMFKKAALKRLVIGVGKEDSLPFDDGPMMKQGASEELLFQEGKSQYGFECDGDANSLAVDPGNIADRKLLLWTASNSGFLDQLGLGSEQEDPEYQLVSARLEVGQLATEGDTEVLRAELEEDISEASRLAIGVDVAQAADLKVKYDCRVDGTAMVTLRLDVARKDRKPGSVCMRWKKLCTIGWKDLEIKEVQPNVPGNSLSGTKVFSNGEFNEDWTNRMANEGTKKGVTQFQLTSKGIVRLRRPQIESNQRLVSVEALGPMIYADGPSEVSAEPISLTVTYVCNFDGFADMTLLLEKDTLLEEDQPEKLVLQWRKHCGVTMYKNLHMYIRNDANKSSRTQVVDSGKVRSGFVRPCTGLNLHAQVMSDCSQKQLTYEVSEKEIKTSLDIEIDSNGVMEMPVFDPPPDLTYNGKVMKVMVTQLPHRSTGIHPHSGKQRNSQHRKQVLTVKYTCFKEGNSTVTVTFHVRDHKAIYLAWRKKCVEPKVHVSKALTAPQAIAVTMFVCAVIGLVACMVFILSGGESSNETKRRGKYSHVQDDIELSKSRAGAEVVGNTDSQGEVTYH
mmetsp:Transcript_112997/g.205471  ORF Transcript_112997/g.205471 Transcript_112997/m.205471 type:complete len:640 (-) Transcript_112997:31-1950(-)